MLRKIAASIDASTYWSHLMAEYVEKAPTMRERAAWLSQQLCESMLSHQSIHMPHQDVERELWREGHALSLQVLADLVKIFSATGTKVAGRNLFCLRNHLEILIQQCSLRLCLLLCKLPRNSSLKSCEAPQILTGSGCDVDLTVGG